MKTLYSLVLFCVLSNYGLAQTEFAPLGAKWYFSSSRDFFEYGNYQNTVGIATECECVNEVQLSSSVVKEIKCYTYGGFETTVYLKFENGFMYKSLNGIDYLPSFNFDTQVGDTLLVALSSVYRLEASSNQLGLNYLYDFVHDPHVFMSRIKITEIDTVIHGINKSEFVYTYSIIPDSTSQSEGLYYALTNNPEIYKDQKLSSLTLGNGAINNGLFIPRIYNAEPDVHDTVYHMRLHYGESGLRLRCYEEDNFSFTSPYWSSTLLTVQSYVGISIECDFSYPMSIESLKNNIEISIYPNPVSETLQIQSEGLKSIVLTDVSGCVLQQKVISNKSHAILNLHNLPKGMYVIQVETTRGVHTEKIVKVE